MPAINVRANCFTGGVGGSATAYSTPVGQTAYISNICLIARNATNPIQVLLNGVEVCSLPAEASAAQSAQATFDPPFPLPANGTIQINAYSGAGGDFGTITVQGYTL